MTMVLCVCFIMYHVFIRINMCMVCEMHELIQNLTEHRRSEDGLLRQKVLTGTFYFWSNICFLFRSKVKRPNAQSLNSHVIM